MTRTPEQLADALLDLYLDAEETAINGYTERRGDRWVFNDETWGEEEPNLEIFTRARRLLGLAAISYEGTEYCPHRDRAALANPTPQAAAAQERDSRAEFETWANEAAALLREFLAHSSEGCGGTVDMHGRALALLSRTPATMDLRAAAEEIASEIMDTLRRDLGAANPHADRGPLADAIAEVIQRHLSAPASTEKK
jgi:hypothetical protein